MPNPKLCYYIPEAQFKKINGKIEYTPSVIKEGEMGHFPMEGKEEQEPWYWGDYETACNAADKMNEKLGLTKEEVHKMVVQAMFG